MANSSQYKREIEEITEFAEKFYFLGSVGLLPESFNNSRKLAEAVCKLYLFVHYGNQQQITQTQIEVKNRQNNWVSLSIDPFSYDFFKGSNREEPIMLSDLKFILSSKINGRIAICNDYQPTLKPIIEHLQNIGNPSSHSSGGRHQSNENDFTNTIPKVADLLKWCFQRVFSENIATELQRVINGGIINFAKYYPDYKKLNLEKETILFKIKKREAELAKSEQVTDNILNDLKISLSKLNEEINFFEKQIESLAKQLCSGDFNNLTSLYREALKFAIDKNDIDMAIQILDDENLDEAEILLAKNRLLKAELLTAKFDFNNAKLNYEKSISICPNYDNLISYATFLTYRNDYLDAIITFEKCIDYSKSNEERIAVKNNLGFLYQKTQRYDLSEREYNDILKLVYKNIEIENADYYLLTVLNNLGSLYLDKKDYDNANKFLSEAIKIGSKSSNVVTYAKTMGNYAQLLLSIGKLKPAEEYLLASIHLIDENKSKYSSESDYKEDSMMFHSALSNLYILDKKNQNAINYLGVALRLCDELLKIDYKRYVPHLVILLQRLSKVEEDVNDKIATISQALYFQEKLAQEEPNLYKPNLAQLYFDLAELYAKKNSVSQAITYFEKAIMIYELLYNRNKIIYLEVLCVCLFYTFQFMKKHNLDKKEVVLAKINTISVQHKESDFIKNMLIALKKN